MQSKLYGKSRGGQIELTKWYGRLGNNILQVMNAIYIGKKTQSKVVLNPQFPKFLSLKSISNKLDFRHPKLKRKPLNFVVKGTWLLESDLKPFPLPSFKEYQTIANEFLRDIYEIKANSILPQSHVVIHIRSGDLFEEDPHPNYGQPPLIYYKTAIAHINENIIPIHRVTIVTESDMKNPTIKPLIEWCKETNINVSLQSSDIESDMKYILSAQTLITSFSTFTKTLILFSNNLNTIITTFKNKDISQLDSIDSIVYDFPDYDVMKGKWIGSQSQLESMLIHNQIKIIQS